MRDAHVQVQAKRRSTTCLYFCFYCLCLGYSLCHAPGAGKAHWAVQLLHDCGSTTSRSPPAALMGSPTSSCAMNWMGSASPRCRRRVLPALRLRSIRGTARDCAQVPPPPYWCTTKEVGGRSSLGLSMLIDAFHGFVASLTCLMASRDKHR
jgi:hypothetical protein